jgi:hypothetical protein
MPDQETACGALLEGPLLGSGQWPLDLRAILCDLRPRFLPKGQVGRGYRAIARNGRVLLASSLPLVEWTGQAAHLRLQTWRKILLPHDPPQPYGILLSLRPAAESAALVEYECVLTPPGDEPHQLRIDVGGRMVLTIRRRVP